MWLLHLVAGAGPTVCFGRVAAGFGNHQPHFPISLRGILHGQDRPRGQKVGGQPSCCLLFPCVAFALLRENVCRTSSLGLASAILGRKTKKTEGALAALVTGICHDSCHGACEHFPTPVACCTFSLFCTSCQRFIFDFSMP